MGLLLEKKWNDKWSVGLNLLDNFIVMLWVISFLSFDEDDNLVEEVRFFGLGLWFVFESIVDNKLL